VIVSGLLVSVRSVAEAKAAVAGGAAIVDVKEPARGPLGRADPQVWSEVRRVVPESIPVSVALGELHEWIDPGGLDASDFAGVAFRKLGLAGAAPHWRRDWERIRRGMGAGPLWIAVAYADWRLAGAPHPDEVLEAALGADDCGGLLVDTWDKTRRNRLDASWGAWLARARAAGRLTVLSGSLDETSIAELVKLNPDYFGVRGAACRVNDRLAAIDSRRVARLVRAAAGTGDVGFAMRPALP
jgi:hypothetical protein